MEGDWSDHQELNVLPLYYMSLAGLKRTTQSLLEDGSDVNLQGTYGGKSGSLLYLVSSRGDKIINHLLLNKERSGGECAEGNMAVR